MVGPIDAVNSGQALKALRSTDLPAQFGIVGFDRSYLVAQLFNLLCLPQCGSIEVLKMRRRRKHKDHAIIGQPKQHQGRCQ